MAEDAGWVLINLDEKMAKRHGMPVHVPVPKSEFDGLGEGGLTHDSAQKWVKSFLGQASAGWRTQYPDDAKAFDAYIAKQSFWQKAQTAFERQDFAAAIQSLTLITNLDRNDYSAKQNLAMAYAAAGKLPEALALFAEAAPVWQGVADFHVAHANALRLAEQKERATEEFVLALEAQADCRPAMEGLVALGVLLKIYEDPLDAKSQIFVRADSVKSYLDGEWQKAEHDAAHYLRLVGYHEEEGRFDVMLAAAERALGASGGVNVVGALAKARALRKLSRVAEARAVATEILASHPESASAHVELYECALKEDDAATAASELDQALALEPGHLSALSFKFLPREASDLDELSRKLPELERFAEQHATVSGVWRVLARARKRAGDETRSLESYAKAVELASDDEDVRAEYWSELGQAARFEDVLRDAERLGEMGKRDWKLRWSEAEALIGAGKRTEARVAFTAINADASLHVAVRARAKRAAQALGG